MISLSRTHRKLEHIQLALSAGQLNQSGMDDIQIIHQSLPDSSLSKVSLHTGIGELNLSSPIFINAMTGGGGAETEKINSELAVAARETGLAIAVGSQMSAIKNKEERKTYEIVRKNHPNGIIFANLGSEATIEQANIAVEMIEANGLQIHLNVIQELTMPEGDRAFEGALERIERISEELPVPVIVKEVGFGMGYETVKKLTATPICAIDIGGFGGTNFAKIENERRRDEFSFFNHWGIPTSVSLVEACEVSDHVQVLASGGIHSSLDIVKSLIIGASAVGMAGSLLKILKEKGISSLISQIQTMHQDIANMMTALGCHTIKELQTIPILFTGMTHHWLNERGINTSAYSQRMRL
ncbi:MAG TPA: type 2 isopentenyl-diphosphate Delta-isomerase [Bacillus sp. (in: firmicutes)]|nr:type 2 isopentenyl-diphosphate Delta-isomerase [Bacillus litorisediminis]HWO75850.1 type 2 isopentenyl-diphosphate Delta-isomerase [Bacillus sp. (in: firmicutes)]